MIALDASLALAWTFADERTEAITAIFRRVVSEGACVPAHWHLEIANSMRKAIRRGRVSVPDRDGYLADLSRIHIDVDEETADRAWTTILAVSDRYGLTTYDAAYFEISLRRELPLATLDQELIAAAHGAGIEVLP